LRPIKPNRLFPGDTVAIVSPSWGGPSTYPWVYKKGIQNLQNLGLKIKEYPTARADTDYIYNNPQVRAKDINDAFADKEVKAIITTIGGDDSIRILPFLDKEMALNNPKILMGYSDTTTVTTFYNYFGLVTFSGPSVMAGFSQMESLGDQFQQHIKDFLFGNTTNYTYRSFPFYSEGYPDFEKKENSGKIKNKKQPNGWHWLQGRGVVHGNLFGGCIEVLEFLKGTSFWFPSNFFKEKIFFLETSEEKPSISQVKYMLRNYGIQGVLDKISAILFGRARDYSDDEKKLLDDTILKIIKQEFGNKNVTIVTNMDFGHTDPQFILPLGIKAELDNNKQTFKLNESIFR